MKAIHLTAFGDPAVGTACVELPDPPPPGPGEVAFDVVAFPINPADLLLLRGQYAAKPPLPAIPGAEMAGRVTAVGPGVTDLAAGDVVLPLVRENWQQRRVLPAADLIAVRAPADPLQLAMLRVNPATAAAMLEDFVALEAGDWVIQNAANSAVGSCVIRLARRSGWRTVNVVRREALAEPLAAEGADVVLVDGPDLPARVAEATAGSPPRLAIDAVAGEATARLAASLAEGGTVVNYGMLCGEPCRMPPHELIFRSIGLVGFWLMKKLNAMTRPEKQAFYDRLAALVADGTLAMRVEATYPIERIAEALAHAAREGRDGKILVTPNGPVSSAA